MRKRTFIIFIIAVALFLFGILATVYISFENKKNGEELLEMLSSLEEKENISKEQTALLAVLDSTKEKRSELYSRVVKGEAGTITFLSQIDRLANVLGLELTTQSLNVAPKARGNYDGLSVQYNFTGSESSVRSFIRALDTLPYNGAMQALTVNRIISQQTGAIEVSGSATLILTMSSIEI